MTVIDLASDAQDMVFDQLAHEEVSAIDVLHAAVVFRIVGDIYCRLVVDEQVGGLGVAHV